MRNVLNLQRDAIIIVNVEAEKIEKQQQVDESFTQNIQDSPIKSAEYTYDINIKFFNNRCTELFKLASPVKN